MLHTDQRVSAQCQIEQNTKHPNCVQKDMKSIQIQAKGEVRTNIHSQLKIARN